MNSPMRTSVNQLIHTTTGRKIDGSYKDIPGFFCKCATLDELRELDYVLIPGRYVGLPEEEDDFWTLRSV